jgi:hypothetical protein
MFHRTIALLIVIVLVLPGLPTTRAETGATLEGFVRIPCDPSRLSEVVAVRVQPRSGDSATTLPVDPSTGRFVGQGLSEGEYELVALDSEGQPLNQKSTTLLLESGPNAVVLTLEPAGCGEPASQQGSGASGAGTSGAKRSLKDWQLTLIYFGVVGAVILALNYDEDEEPASPF